MNAPPLLVGTDAGASSAGAFKAPLSPVGVDTDASVGMLPTMGCPVGSLLGRALGESVGFRVGLRDGVSVGVLVGLAVGLMVGALVGVAVGFRVGEAVLLSRATKVHP